MAGGAAPGRSEPGGTRFDSRLVRIAVFDTTIGGTFFGGGGSAGGSAFTLQECYCS